MPWPSFRFSFQEVLSAGLMYQRLLCRWKLYILCSCPMSCVLVHVPCFLFRFFALCLHPVSFLSLFWCSVFLPVSCAVVYIVCSCLQSPTSYYLPFSFPIDMARGRPKSITEKARRQPRAPENHGKETLHSIAPFLLILGRKSAPTCHGTSASPDERAHEEGTLYTRAD